MEPHSSLTISHASAEPQSPQQSQSHESQEQSPSQQQPVSQQQLSGQQQSARDAAGATGDCMATNASIALASSTENFARIIKKLLPELASS
jgi:hypothetical protein